MLRLNEKIDHASAEWFQRLRTLPPCEQRAIVQAVRCGVQHETIAEIPDALLTIDVVLAALWGEWREVLAVEAWTAVLKTIFAREEA